MAALRPYHNGTLRVDIWESNSQRYGIPSHVNLFRQLIVSQPFEILQVRVLRDKRTRRHAVDIRRSNEDASHTRKAPKLDCVRFELASTGIWRRSRLPIMLFRFCRKNELRNWLFRVERLTNPRTHPQIPLVAPALEDDRLCLSHRLRASAAASRSTTLAEFEPQRHLPGRSDTAALAVPVAFPYWNVLLSSHSSIPFTIRFPCSDSNTLRRLSSGGCLHPRATEFWRFSYWNPTRMTVVDSMHCILEGLVHYHCRKVLRLDAKLAKRKDEAHVAFTHNWTDYDPANCPTDYHLGNPAKEIGQLQRI
ncbi:hypothetical protein C8J57DRAFT_1537840 [Mycena rebaudengoi]|nr:hypothetical protein C8J57DRAFT_1537840 [Mycena rebaudengoi]